MDAAYSDDVFVDDRTIDSHIKRLRRKFRAVDPQFCGDRNALRRRLFVHRWLSQLPRTLAPARLVWTRRTSLTVADSGGQHHRAGADGGQPVLPRFLPQAAAGRTLQAGPRRSARSPPMRWPAPAATRARRCWSGSARTSSCGCGSTMRKGELVTDSFELAEPSFQLRRSRRRAVVSGRRARCSTGRWTSLLGSAADPALCRTGAGQRPKPGPN